MNEDLLRELIENLKMDSSIQTETIKEKLKKLIHTAYEKGKEEERNRIIKLIKQDIEFQSSKLKHDFESDKAIQWRLTGMKFMIKKINQDVNVATGEGEGK